MTDIPENAPSSCPGTGSNDAGKTTPCQGCPNQSSCLSGEASEPDTALYEIEKNLASVKHIVIVLSGKGGVGKSTVSANLARGLARDENSQVGLLDLDICGPSLPQILGCPGEQVYQSGSGWSPVYVQDNLSLMSIDFLVNNPKEAVIWRGPKKNGLIKQFLLDVDWGTLDWLIIDTPPGTSDEHMSSVNYLYNCNLRGAIVVTTPQEIALQDVRKQINFCNKVKLPIIGVIENMSGFVCPNCSKVSEIFPASTGGGEGMCDKFGLKFLGKLPLDPRIGQLSDAGESILDKYPESIAAKQYLSFIRNIETIIL